MNRGALIVFEGIDGSGKGTQIRMLKKRLEKEGYPVFRSAEPNDSPFGALIHQIMIGRVRTTNDAIAALFVADRLEGSLLFLFLCLSERRSSDGMDH